MVEETDSTRNRRTTYNLLFVCTGNTCRSPMAMAIGRREVERRGWSHVAVASAGIMAGPGQPATDAARRVAEEEGLDLEAHRSRPLTRDLVDWADLILVMTPAHREAVGGGDVAEKVALVTDFADGDGGGAPVSDPFGSDEERYRGTFRELEEAVGSVLNRLEPILSP